MEGRIRSNTRAWRAGSEGRSKEEFAGVREGRNYRKRVAIGASAGVGGQRGEALAVIEPPGEVGEAVLVAFRLVLALPIPPPMPNLHSPGGKGSYTHAKQCLHCEIGSAIFVEFDTAVRKEALFGHL